MNQKLVTALLFSEDFRDVLVVRTTVEEGRKAIGFPQDIAEAEEPTHYSLPCLAAARAMKEASGFDIPVQVWFRALVTKGVPDNWVLYTTVPTKTLFQIAADRVGDVYVVPCEAVLAKAWSDPESYIPGFIDMMAGARKHAFARKKDSVRIPASSVAPVLPECTLPECKLSWTSEDEGLPVVAQHVLLLTPRQKEEGEFWDLSVARISIAHGGVKPHPVKAGSKWPTDFYWTRSTDGTSPHLVTGTGWWAPMTGLSLPPGAVHEKGGNGLDYIYQLGTVFIPQS